MGEDNDNADKWHKVTNDNISWPFGSDELKNTLQRATIKICILGTDETTFSFYMHGATFLLTFRLGDCTFHSLYQADIYGTLQAYHIMSYNDKDMLLFYTKWGIFHLYHAENKSHFPFINQHEVGLLVLVQQ